MSPRYAASQLQFKLYRICHLVLALVKPQIQNPAQVNILYPTCSSNCICHLVFALIISISYTESQVNILHPTWIDPQLPLNGRQQMAPPQSRPPYPCGDTFLSATHPLKCIHIYLAIQPGEKTTSSSIFLKQKKYLTVEGQTMSTNTVAVPLQGRAWANDSIGGLAAGQQDKHNTHIFIRQLHAGHMAIC